MSFTSWSVSFSECVCTHNNAVFVGKYIMQRVITKTVCHLIGDQIINIFTLKNAIQWIKMKICATGAKNYEKDLVGLYSSKELLYMCMKTWTLKSNNVKFTIISYSFQAASITLKPNDDCSLRLLVVVWLASHSALFNLPLCVGSIRWLLQCPDPLQRSDRECVFSLSSLIEHHSAL